MACAVIIGLFCVAVGRAVAEVEVPSPPAALNLPLKSSAFEAQVLPELYSPTQAVVLTPLLNQQSLSRRDPKYGWQFAAACYGYFRNEHLSQPELRFRVYVQQLEDLPRAQKVCRLLLRLQQVAWHKLRLQVNMQGERVLNVWLCRQGNAGGEQWRNNLYIYSIQQVHNPLEWLREVAHELSHALLPGITGYTLPEPWANGYMGERLFLMWLAPLLNNGQLTPSDLCDASAEDVRSFVQQRCLPLRNQWMTGGFPKDKFQRRDALGMGALIGHALYIDSVYGHTMLRATFARMAEPSPDAFWKAFMEAVREADEIQIIPSGKTSVWLPKGLWRAETEDNKAMLQTGTNRWQAGQPIWRLPTDGWYQVTSQSPLRLLRATNAPQR